MGDPASRTSDPVEAVQRLFLKNTDVLQGFIIALVPDLAAAEDVFQEVFLTVSRLAPKFRPGTDFLAWARAIAVLKARESYRLRKGAPRRLASVFAVSQRDPLFYGEGFATGTLADAAQHRPLSGG